MGKGETQRKGEAEVEQVAESADSEKWKSRNGDRVSKKKHSCRKEKQRQKEKQRWNKHQNQQTMKSGKAQEGTVSKKRNSCRKEKQGKRRSMGKGEAWEKEKQGKRRSRGKIRSRG